MQEMASQVTNMNDLLVVQHYESSDDRQHTTTGNLATDADHVDHGCHTMTSDRKNGVERKSEMKIVERKTSQTSNPRPWKDTNFLARM